MPAIARWPGRIRPGVSDQTVLTFDLLPTLLALAGQERPTLAAMDGVDVSALLLDGKALAPRTLFWRMRQKKAVRRGPWKLVQVGEGAPMLFDLAADLGEERDVAGQNPELVAALQAAFAGWEKNLSTGPAPERTP